MTLLAGVDNYSPDAINNNNTSSSIAQIIPGRLYFTSFADSIPKNDLKTIYVDIDEQVHYDAFYDDFGPLNLSVLYRFCHYLNELLRTHRPSKRIFIYTQMCPESRVNAVYLLASYMIIYHNLSAEQAYLRLQTAEPPKFIGFRDASLGPPSYLLHVQHVVQSIGKALKYKWLDFENFDPDEYEFFERVENGDLNWIIPGKVLSFCGPHEKSYVENGYPYHSPEVYFDYFRQNNVTNIIRLNKKIYDAKHFIEAGFKHHDLFFIDGSTPSDDIVLQFIEIIDSAKGAVAVHCKAGLGRTGTLIACWMMKHFRLTAPQCMGWLRVCRPGSVIGPQQQFLIDKQAWCWRLGQDEKTASNSTNIKKAEPINISNGTVPLTKQPLQNGTAPEIMANNKAIWSAREAMEMETAVNEAGKTQGDRLCEIKASRQHRHYWLRPHGTVGEHDQHNPSVPSTLALSAFVLPSTNFNTKHSTTAIANSPTTTTMQHRQTKNNSNIHKHPGFSSATTPIKQLKLSATPAAAVTTIQHRHYGNGVAKTTKPTKTATTTTELLRNLRTTNNELPLKAEKQTHQPNDIVAKFNAEEISSSRKSSRIASSSQNNSKIPINKVSVASSTKHHALSNANTIINNNDSDTAALQFNRTKHYSSLRLLKPYMPISGTNGGHHTKAMFNGRTMAALNHNNNNSVVHISTNGTIVGLPETGKRRSSYHHHIGTTTTTTTMEPTTSSTTAPSSSTAFARNLNRQYVKISYSTSANKFGGSGLQHSNSSGQIHHLMLNNNNNGVADQRPHSPQPFSSPVDGPLAHQTNCKYELRPRHQLNIPSRFGGAAEMMVASTTTTTNNINNSSSSPFPMSRHHKQSRSSTGMFVSRL